MRIELGIPMHLYEIAEATGGTVKSADNPLITHITTDSRELNKDDLFIAIRGRNFNGESFIHEVRQNGGYVLSQNDESDIIHADSITALLSFAEYYVKNLPYILYKIGITGSVGKTTTKEFLNVILSRRYTTHASPGNHNNEIGLPLSILQAKVGTEILLMEMGMNHPGEIARLSKCLHPNLALITNIGTAHIGNFGSRSNIAKSKLEIIEGMEKGVIFVPEDESLLYSISNRISFSTTDKSANFYLDTMDEGNIRIYKNGNLFCQSKFKLKENHHKECLIAAVGVATFAGVSADKIAEGISLISSANTRQNIIYREKYSFYVDYYNASRESVLACIKAAEDLNTNQAKSLLLGDILELGDMNEKIHFEIGKSISPTVFSFLFLFGEFANHIANGAMQNGFPSDRILINTDLSAPQKTAEQIRACCGNGEIIFMKASRKVKLERVLRCFSE